MAINAYMKVKDITGQSKAKAGHIDIEAFSFGVSQNVHPGLQGEDKHSGKADFQCVNISKVVDKTSTELFVNCAKGNVFENVKLTYEKPVKGGKQEEYFYIELTNAIIANVSYSGSTEHPREQVSFNCAKGNVFENVKLTYEKPVKGGKQEEYFYIELTNAIIA